jgi:radical SAM protein with 4Fe4S-binding SPASM domain
MDILKIISNDELLLKGLKGIRNEPIVLLPILSAKIKPLWQCNLSCEFCELPKPGKPLDKEYIRQLLLNLKECGTKKVHFSGGEIFLHPQIMDILKMAIEYDFQVNFTTNGTLLNKEMIKELVSLKIHSISFSLDSGNPALHDKLRGIKGSFKHTLNIIKILNDYRKKEPKIIINTVLSNKNIDTLDDLHNLLLNTDNQIQWNLFPIDPKRKRSLLEKSQIDRLISISGKWKLLNNFILPENETGIHLLSKGKYALGYYKEHICYATWLQMFIDPQGFVYPCCKSRGRMPAFGKFDGNNLNDIMNEKNTAEFKMNMVSGNIPEFCHYCDDFLWESMEIDNLINHLPK